MIPGSGRSICKLGPDGALYIADFYNRIIGHYEVPLDHPGRDRERGRIWRVVYTSSPKTPRQLPAAPNIAKADAKQLVNLLADTNITVRTLATNELVHRIGTPCIPIVRSRLKDAGSSASQRAHGLWVLERIGAPDDDLVQCLLNDADRTVRIQAIRVLAERDTSLSSLPITKLVRAKLADDDAFVRRAACRLPGPPSGAGRREAAVGFVA